MSNVKKILLVILIVIVVGAIAGFAMLKHWARPNRLGVDECHRLVLSSMKEAQSGSLTGWRVLEYRLDGRIVRERLVITAPINYIVSLKFQDRIFETSDEFFNNVDLRHMGRLRVAGRTCERIRLSPSGYSGDSVEVWIDPETDYMLGYRRFDSKGQLIRGYRFRSITGYVGAGQVLPAALPVDESLPGLGPIDSQSLLEPDVIREHVERGEIALPGFLPPGFELVGARIMESQRPGMRAGPGPGMGAGPGPGRMQGPQVAQSFTVYSDGLNTISVIQIPMFQIMDSAATTANLDEILGMKAKEVQRIFHTAMAWKHLPNCIVILYGEISQELLMDVAASISDQALTPTHQMQPPGDGGIRPDFEPPPGFERLNRPNRPGLGPRNRPGDSE